MAFPPRFLEDLRGRVSITDVVGRRVRLIRKGRGEATGLCPFHNEKTPSFTVSEDKGFFHCFGCGAHGDVIGFVMRSEGLEFPQAVEKLAGEAGMQVPRETPEERERAERQATLGGAVEFAAKYYEQQLRASAGRAGLDYFKRRGLSDDTMRRFRLGFAPDNRTGLKAALEKAGIPEAISIEAGLLIKPPKDEGPSSRTGDGGHAYDRFRGRVMFPILDRRGQAIAFGGRILDQGEPKYLNSPGDAALSQRPRALWPQPRPEDRARDQRDHRGRRLYGRDRTGPGRDQQRGRAARHRLDRGPDRLALAHGARSRSSVSTATMPASARPRGRRIGRFRC